MIVNSGLSVGFFMVISWEKNPRMKHETWLAVAKSSVDGASTGKNIYK